MKNLSIILAAFVVIFVASASPAASVDRISAATGIPVATLQAERASTGLGWGSLEKAHLLANATGQSFDTIVALHQGGQGWGKIAHNNGLNLGNLVSTANRSSHAATHAKNTRTTRGRSGSHVGKGHSAKNMTRGSSGSHRMGSMGRSSGGMRSMGARASHNSGMGHSGGMGHGGGRGR